MTIETIVSGLYGVVLIFLLYKVWGTADAVNDLKVKLAGEYPTNAALGRTIESLSDSINKLDATVENLRRDFHADQIDRNRPVSGEHRRATR